VRGPGPASPYISCSGRRRLGADRPAHPEHPIRIGRAASIPLLLLAACTRTADVATCAECGTVVIAAVREPATVLPPLVLETVGRDVGDRVFERLATLAPGASTIDATSYRPALAEQWERVDSLTWRFRLRADARWHDGTPVVADDVVFSFEAYQDTLLVGPSASALAGVRTRAVDGTTVEVTFPRPGAEQLYDATWHVRVLPRHVWSAVPREAWASDTALARLVGSGPYRITRWERGQSITLDADSTRVPVPAVRRVVWRFAPDPDAALNLLLAHEVDVLETVGGDAQAARVAGDSSLRLVRYPGAVFGFVGFRVAGRDGRPSGALGDRAVRRALTRAVDRAALARAVVGEGASVPQGPMSRLLWIGNDYGADAALSFDTASAAAELHAAGWVMGADGMRHRGATPLAFDVLVPATSSVRRQLAEALQAGWRRVGVAVTVTPVDFPVFQERLARGAFDSYIGAYLDEPSPRGVADQWTRAGFDGLNHGRYANPVVDSLVGLALASGDLASARRLWHLALDSLASDAPAVFLYTPEQRAAVHRRIGTGAIDPFSWLSGIERWTIDQRAPR
jgi:peptide/nickel transport system substrate-binding protein